MSRTQVIWVRLMWLPGPGWVRCKAVAARPAWTVPTAHGDVLASADHLAADAGLASVPNGSSTRTGRLHRPQRYNRRTNVW